MLNLSLEEQERAAYISGDTARADLLGRLIDAEAAVSDRDDKIQELQDEIADARAALA